MHLQPMQLTISCEMSFNLALAVTAIDLTFVKSIVWPFNNFLPIWLFFSCFISKLNDYFLEFAISAQDQRKIFCTYLLRHSVCINMCTVHFFKKMHDFMLLGSLLSEYGTYSCTCCHYSTLQKKDLLFLKFPQIMYRISV
jgi:hypothetical protein